MRQHVEEIASNNLPVAVVRDNDLKMYHAMSMKQSFREDLAEHCYQFSCRASDWPCMSFAHAPLQFEHVELHVVAA